MLNATTTSRLLKNPPVEQRATASTVGTTTPTASAADIKAQQDAIAAASPNLKPSAESPSPTPISATATQASPVVTAQQGTMLTQANVVQSQQIAAGVQVATQADVVDTSGPSQAEIIASITSVNSRDRLIRAVKYGHDLWRLQAHFQSISIHGSIAIGAPGCLSGPDLAPLILSHPEIATVSGLELELCEAVAEGVARCLSLWQYGVSVPGLPWYPMFVAVAAPMAPPTPNIPMPLITCVSAHANKITVAMEIEHEMVQALPAELQVPEVESMMRAIGQSLSLYFTMWLTSQQVMMVMGMGPVPTFNPPYIPVGPVANGWIIPAPGHLIA